MRFVGWLLCGAGLLEAGGCSSTSDPPGAAALVTVDSSTRYQTMTGWEAVAQAGQGMPGFSEWADTLFSLAVNDLGINRLRLEIRAGSENPDDYHLRALSRVAGDRRCERIATVNDNTDPRVAKAGGFHFSEVDSAVVNVVLPVKRLLEARGERLVLNLNYVAFLSQCPPAVYVHQDPEEYAEFILAAFLHLRNRYSLVPDVVEVILEPDNGDSPWNGTLIGRAIVATSRRLGEAGFRPTFVGPSTLGAAAALKFAEDMFSVPGVQGLVGEISYHRYAGASNSRLRALASIAQRNGARTAMLEHIGSGAEDLHADLTQGNVSAWQQYTLAYPSEDNGGHYYSIVEGRPVIGRAARNLRQYFRYVRLGAQRIGASSRTSAVRPVAFLNPDGGMVLVIQVDGAVPVEVRGLRPGRYRATATTADAVGADLGTHTVDANSGFVLTVPAKGIATMFSLRE